MTPVMRHIVAWFRPEDWEELKAMCPPGDLQNTYAEWYENVQGGLKGLGVTEDEIEKSILTPDDLTAGLERRENRFEGPLPARDGACGPAQEYAPLETG
jgi:hypothetical protein